MTHKMASFSAMGREEQCFCYKMILGNHCTWMCLVHPGGDSELKSESQGWSRDSSFAQETRVKIQSQSRIDGEPSLVRIVQDARMFLTHFPSFFLQPVGEFSETLQH